MLRVRELLDNPILVKHWRSRMRPAEFLASATIVVILCFLIAWGGWLLDGYANGGTFAAILALQVVVLVIIGSSQIASSVGAARESGILDFHRVSPLSPLTLALGFFFGGPIRQYALFALTIPFALFCVATGEPTFLGFIQILIAELLVAWALHAVALFNGLTFRKSRFAGRGNVVLLLILLSSGSMGMGLWQATTVLRGFPKVEFFGVPIPWLAFMLIYVAPLIGLALVAATRKMRSERAHLFSKPQAVVCLLLLAFLALGAFGNMIDFEYAPVIVLYALVGVSMLLSLTVTPSAWEFVKGIRRAEKIGRSHPRFWDDLALNRLVLVFFCLIVLGGSELAASASRDHLAVGVGSLRYSYTVANLVGVCLVAYFGLAYQYFSLAFPRRAGALMGLFCFVAWLVPLVVGIIVAIARTEPAYFMVPMSVCPLVGIALSVGIGEHPFGQFPQLAAILPAVGFAFLFNNLVVMRRRRLTKAVQTAAQRKQTSSEQPPALALS